MPADAERCGTPSSVIRTDCGIYQILNTHNGKVYVGRSVGMWKRWLAHRRRLRKGTHKNRHLQAAWTKYGELMFEFKVLEHVAEESLPVREGFHMVRLNACDRDHGYNSVEVDVDAQVRFSDEHKARISAALMGHPVSEENRKAMSEALQNKVWTDEERARASVRQTGRKHTEETKAKIRANGNLGRKFGPPSDEHRAKIAAALKGRKHTPEAKARMSKALKGKPKSPEHCRKMSEQRKGVPRSQESIEKQRATLQGRTRSTEASLKAATANRGRKRTPEQRQRMREGIRAARLRREAEAVE